MLRPRLLTADAPPWILASAIAVAEAVEQTVGDGDAVEIKWPNDVLLGGLKTSGILMELSAEATRVVFLVLGIGVNLNVDRRDFPEEFRATATSLSSHCGRKIDRVAFAQRLYNALERALDTCAERGFEALRPRFEARFRMRGRPLTVLELDGTRQRGVAEGVAGDGALLLRRDGRLAGARGGGRRDDCEGERVTTLLVIDIGNTNVSLGLFDYAGREARPARAPLADRDPPRADLGRGGAHALRALRPRGARDRGGDRRDHLERGAAPAPDLGARLRQALRPAGADRRARASAPACPCATRTRARSAPTGS